MTTHSKPETDALVTLLQSYADDPMWADHAEVSKRVLRLAIERLQFIPAQGSPHTLRAFAAWHPSEGIDINSIAMNENISRERTRRRVDTMPEEWKVGAVDIKPLFLTEWERADHEREKRGEPPLGPHSAVPPHESAKQLCISKAMGGEWCIGKCRDPKDCSASPLASRS